MRPPTLAPKCLSSRLRKSQGGGAERTPATETPGGPPLFLSNVTPEVRGNLG